MNENYYHIYNRGVEKKNIFTNHKDYKIFIDALFFYQFSNPKPSFSTHRRFKKIDFDQNPKIVHIISYCLMPNHFHLLLKQSHDGGVQEVMRKLLNSYTKYFNIKYNRVGPLLQGEFKDVPIETEEQLFHVSRYIHLNPYVSNIIDNLEEYPYSSYLEYLGKSSKDLCIKDLIYDQFKNPQAYKQFVDDQKDYASSLEAIKHHLFDDD